jgi:tetratricopeptide (TPR) repeat protein
VEILVDNPGTRRNILILGTVVALILLYQGARMWVADALVQSEKPSVIARGVALEPGNGDAWDRLGRFHQWDFFAPNPSLAAAEYLRAIHDDPKSAHFLMDLASAYEAEGDNARAKAAWERARAAYPASAEVEWNYGNFLLRQEDYSNGYALIHRAVQTDPSLLPLAISRTWRSARDINALLDQALPATPEAFLQALDFFSSIHNADAALEVWGRIVEMKKNIPIARTFPFFQELIDQDRSEDARQAWIEAVEAAGLPAENRPDHSLVWNGDFSSNFQNGGLDWRWSNPMGAAIDFDVVPSGHPGRAVKIEFEGGVNMDLAEPREYVPVEPGKSYRFRAWMRTEDITTESGMRFNLSDPNHVNALNVTTDNLTASNPWTEEQADFMTGPATHFVVVCLRRTPSRLFDNRLGGTVWIADVSLVENTESPEPATK